MSAVPELPTSNPVAVPRHRCGRGARPAPRSALPLLFAVVAVACNISPQPVPPPDSAEVIIHAELITVFDDSVGGGGAGGSAIGGAGGLGGAGGTGVGGDGGSAIGGAGALGGAGGDGTGGAAGAFGVHIVGNSGAVTPGAGILRALNRVSPSLPVEVTVRDDGSFEAILTGIALDSFRMQARLDMSYSAPVDVQGSGGGSVSVLEPPYGGCVTVEPGREVAFSQVPVGEIDIAPIRVVNGCPFDVGVTSFGPLYGGTPFEPMLGTLSSGFIPIGGEALLGVAFHPQQAGLYEDALLLQFMSQPPDPPQDPLLLPNWVLTVRGVGVEP